VCEYNKMDQPVTCLPGCGAKTTQRLKLLGITTVGDLLKFQPIGYSTLMQAARQLSSKSISAPALDPNPWCGYSCHTLATAESKLRRGMMEGMEGSKIRVRYPDGTMTLEDPMSLLTLRVAWRTWDEIISDDEDEQNEEKDSEVYQGVEQSPEYHRHTAWPLWTHGAEVAKLQRFFDFVLK